VTDGFCKHNINHFITLLSSNDDVRVLEERLTCIQVGFNYKLNPDTNFIVNCKSSKKVHFKVIDTGISIFTYS